jgi:actin-related protein
MVVDYGSDTVKVGYGGEDVPKAIFETKIGARCDAKTGERAVHVGETADMETSSSTSGITSSSSSSSSKFFVGEQQLGVRRDDVGVFSSVKDGLIDDWDACEAVWDYAFKKHMRADPKEHPILVRCGATLLSLLRSF